MEDSSESRTKRSKRFLKAARGDEMGICIGRVHSMAQWKAEEVERIKMGLRNWPRNYAASQGMSRRGNGLHCASRFARKLTFFPKSCGRRREMEKSRPFLCAFEVNRKICTPSCLDDSRCCEVLLMRLQKV